MRVGVGLAPRGGSCKILSEGQVAVQSLGPAFLFPFTDISFSFEKETCGIPLFFCHGVNYIDKRRAHFLSSSVHANGDDRAS